MILLAILFGFQAHANFTDFDNLGTAAANHLPGIISDSKVDEIICGNQYEIKDHMSRMGFIIRSLREMVGDLVGGETADELKAVIMVDVQVLRTHLTAVLPKTPDKIKKVNTAKIQENKIIFQRYLLKMVSYTIDIEEELLKKPINPDEVQAQRLKIANLIIKIDETVTEAHNLFRF